jgi:hypothetical protein
LFVSGIASLGAAVTAPAESSSPRKGGVLRWSLRFDLPSVDPAVAYLPSTWAVESATCALLFSYPDEAGAAGTRVVPEVVDRFTVSSDGKVDTFDL